MRDAVLLKAANGCWVDAVRAAAVLVRRGPVERIQSEFEAMDRLLSDPDGYSDLVIATENGLSDIGDLRSLTSAEGFPRPVPLVLGLAAEELPWVSTLERADVACIAARLRAPRQGPKRPEAAIEAREIAGAYLYDAIATRYQPIVRIDDRAPSCVEVLARFSHRTRGVLPPEMFLEHVEKAGRVEEFTSAVMSRGLEVGLGGLLRAHGISLAFNFPVDVFFLPGMVARLDEQCRIASVDPRAVIVELIERRPDVDIAALARVVKLLRTRGYGVAIDDFGPATAQQQAVLDLPFTSLKLDMHVVRRTSEGSAAADFVAHAIECGKRRGMKIVVEGVEDAATWDRMAALGADEAQGFAIARPLPASAVSIWREVWRRQPFQTSW